MYSLAIALLSFVGISIWIYTPYLMNKLITKIRVSFKKGRTINTKNHKKKTKQEDKWWIGLIVILAIIFAVVAILYAVPVKNSVLHPDGPVCSKKGHSCYTGEVKAISRGSNDSMIISVSVTWTDEQSQKQVSVPTFKLTKFQDDISIGAGVLMNANEIDNTVDLTIQKDTHLLYRLILDGLGATYGPTATVDGDTLEEINQK
jgi:hypothetical protein